VLGLPETKREQGRKFDEIRWVHICICKEERKNRKSNEEGVNKQKKQDSIDNEMHYPFQFVSVLL